jgi:hypothetical protein
MRVALLLSGQVREAREVFPTIKSRIIDRFNTDVFISTWDRSEEIKNSLHADSRFLTDSLSLDETLENFVPKMFILDRYESEGIQKIAEKALSYDTFTTQTGEMNPISVFLMWYKIKQSFILMSAYEEIIGEKYDYVIKGRFDLYFHNDIVLDSNLNTICIPPGYDWKGGVNDIFAWGGRDAMEWYCSLYDYLEDYILSTGFFHPETLLRHHLVSSEYNLERPDLKVSLRGKNVWETEVKAEKFHKKSYRYINPKGNIWDT